MIREDKKGQVIVLRLMVGVIIFIFAMIWAQPTKEAIDTSMNSSGLNCTNPNISTPMSATCTAVDQGLFWFISTLILLSIAFITGTNNITGLATTIFAFIVVVVMITPLKDLIILLRDADHLACGTAGLSKGANLTCLVADVWLFWFVAIVITTAIALTWKKQIKPMLGFRE